MPSNVGGIKGGKPRAASTPKKAHKAQKPKKNASAEPLPHYGGKAKAAVPPPPGDQFVPMSRGGMQNMPPPTDPPVSGGRWGTAPTNPPVSSGRGGMQNTTPPSDPPISGGRGGMPPTNPPVSGGRNIPQAPYNPNPPIAGGRW